MGKIERNPNGTLSRRGFLEGAAGLTFALSIPGALFVRPAAALAEGGTPAALGAWVTIGPDGAIVLAIPVAEMGQGSLDRPGHGVRRRDGRRLVAGVDHLSAGQAGDFRQSDFWRP